MKLFSLIVAGSLLATSPLISAEPVSLKPIKRSCHCVNCQCTPEHHCGCYSDKGCHCAAGTHSCGREPSMEEIDEEQPVIRSKQTASRN